MTSTRKPHSREYVFSSDKDEVTKPTGLHMPPNGLAFHSTNKAQDSNDTKSTIMRLFTEFSAARNRVEATAGKYFSLSYGTGAQRGVHTVKNAVDSFLSFNIPQSTLLDSEYWRADFEPVDVVDVKWDLGAATVVRGKTHCVADKVMKNGADMPQRFRWSYPEDLAWGGYAVHTSGFPLRPDVVITSGLPTLVDNKLVMENRLIKWKMGPQVQLTISCQGEYPIQLAPKSTTHIFVMSTCARISVPFVLHLKGKNSGVETSTNGLWAGSIAGHHAPFEWPNHCGTYQ